MVLTNERNAGNNCRLFPEVNVLEQGIEQVQRSLQEKKAFFLNSLNSQRLKIYFTDKTGVREIKTSVWTITEKAIILKQSKVIPLANIIAVAA